jgi:formate dehydrogenase maturation protein FdhE
VLVNYLILIKIASPSASAFKSLHPACCMSCALSKMFQYMNWMKLENDFLTNEACGKCSGWADIFYLMQNV